ncbi:hypothetical protein LCGC14_0936990 [marine sediment metagenome]|uniref:Uncharacterized protein n=1 Tax=marine sediment metagenome TaxID=412755 RepID=A0A0F9P7C1_9ZZZZ
MNPFTFLFKFVLGFMALLNAIVILTGIAIIGYGLWRWLL